MCPDQIAITIIDIDPGLSGTDLQLLPEIFAGHGVVNRIIYERKIRTDCYGLTHKVLIRSFRERQQRFLFLFLKQIPAGIAEPGEIDAVLCIHPFPQFGIEIIQGIKGHLIHFDKDVHGDDTDVPFYIRFPTRRANFGRKNNSPIVGSPGLEFRIQTWINPVFILGNGDLAVIGRNSLGNPAKVRQCVIVHADPVSNVTESHAFDVKQVAE